MGFPGISIPKTKFRIGERNIKIGEVPPKVGKIKRNKMITP